MMTKPLRKQKQASEPYNRSMRIHRDTLTWKTTIESQTETIDIPVVSIHAEEKTPDELPILALCGMGERLGTAKQLVRRLGEQGVAHALSLRLPFESLPPSEANLTRICVEIPHLAAQALAQRAKRASPQKREDSLVNMIARSQSAAAALIAVHECPELFFKTALVQPFGLTNHLLGNTPKERADALGERVARNLTFGFRENKSLVSVAELLLAVRTRKAREHAEITLHTALGGDLRPIFHAAVRSGKEIRVFGSKPDPLFPFDELTAAVGEEHVTEVWGAHASTVSPNGFRQLDTVLQWLL